MKVNETRHAYIDLEDKEVEKLNNVLVFLEELNYTINRLEKENIEWDIRSNINEDVFFSKIADIKDLANELVS